MSAPSWFADLYGEYLLTPEATSVYGTSELRKLLPLAWLLRRCPAPPLRLPAPTPVAELKQRWQEIRAAQRKLSEEFGEEYIFWTVYMKRPWGMAEHDASAPLFAKYTALEAEIYAVEVRLDAWETRTQWE